MIDIRVLGRTEASLAITAYVTVLLIATTLLPAELAQTPSPAPTVLTPFYLLKLAEAPLIGSIAGEGSDVLTVSGAAIVFASSFYIAWRKATLRRADGAGVDCPPPRCAVHAGSPLAPGQDRCQFRLIALRVER